MKIRLSDDIVTIDIEVTIDDKTSVYGDSLEELTYTITSGSVAEGDDLGITLSKEEGEDVGTYAITGAWTNNKYKVIFNESTYSIEKRSITVKIDDKSSEYGDSFVDLTYTVTSGSELSESPVGITLSKENGTAVGTYTISGTFSNANYEVVLEEGTYTIYHISYFCPECKEEITDYCRHVDSIHFGQYPQSKVSDSGTINALNNAISFSTKKPTKVNNNGWISYKYYISGSNSTDFMWYIDKEYNGNKYRGVYFTSYRPYSTTDSSSAEKSYQDDNGYYTSTIYWFQYEPIKWRILEEKDGYVTILAELILDSQDYYSSSSSSSFSHNGGTGYANNYALSNIRKWLNETFYNTAFSSMQQALIQTVTLDNSARSTTDTGNNLTWASGYACGNTNDKVWLLSEQEVTKSDWVFASYDTKDTARRKTTSDYARSQGASTESGGTYDGKGYWWLRSPYYNYSSSARHVGLGGYARYYNYVYFSYGGVVPALKIRLS